MESQHGGTNKEIIDFFSQNLNTICVFRFKSPFSNFSGQQYTGKLIDVYNALHKFDVMQNASIIINGTEYEGTIGLIQKYLHEAKTNSDMVKSGMLTPPGPKYTPYNMMNLPLNKLFKTFGNELITMFHLFRESGSSENKIAIISLLTQFKEKLSMVPGDQYVNLKLLCDNAIVEVNNITDNPVSSYIQEIKNQIINDAGSVAFTTTLDNLKNTIKFSIGEPPLNILTGGSVRDSNNRIRRYFSTVTVPRGNLSNITATENIYIKYYNIVENILNVLLNGFGETVLAPFQKELAIIAGVDSILTFYDDTNIRDIVPYNDDVLCILFGANVRGTPNPTIREISSLFLHNHTYDFLTELCGTVPAGPANIDVLTRHIIQRFYNYTSGSDLIMQAIQAIPNAVVAGNILNDGLTNIVNARLAFAVPPPMHSFSDRVLMEIFDGVNQLNVGIADIQNMNLLYVSIIASKIFRYIYELELNLAIFNHLSQIGFPPGIFVGILGGNTFFYDSYASLFDANGTRRVNLTGILPIVHPMTQTGSTAGAGPLPGPLPGLQQIVDNTDAIIGGMVLPLALPVATGNPAMNLDVVKNNIYDEINIDIFTSVLLQFPDYIESIKYLRIAIGNIFEILDVLKNQKNNELIITSILENIKKINTEINGISYNLIDIGTTLQAVQNDIVDKNNKLNNIVIVSPTNINIFSKEIELLLNQLSVM